MERRLAAILVVGYSRLMGANEVGTLSALKALGAGLVDGAIHDHGGRIVMQTGDGILAEYPSVVSALDCAVHIQNAMRLRNLDVPDDRQIQFRIGINLGDVIFDDGDIFGDGVNIAARIEALAKPGGVALSGAAREQIGKKRDLVFEAAGEHVLKNIDTPIAIFHAVLEDGARARAETRTSARPGIAVLPFLNMSGDTEQDYFADGITEDIITDLSRISGLFVVGRNSVFVYRGKPVNLQQAARELGVRHILEGSVRKAGNRVRITAQLIDGATGGHLWADRYDRDLNDIFAVQDDITRTIIGQLKVRLLAAEARAIEQLPTSDVEAYSYYLRGRRLFHMWTLSFIEDALHMFEKAIEHDPNYGRAYAGIADCLSRMNEWHGRQTPFGDILEFAEKALALDPALPEAHVARGLALETNEQDEKALRDYSRALELDPLCYEAHFCLGRFYLRSQAFDNCARHFIRALEIQPEDYRSPLLLYAVLNNLGQFDLKKRYLQLGLKRAEEAAALHPDHSDPLELGAATLATDGQHDLARAWLARALERRVGRPEQQNYNIVCVYAQLGETDLALEQLEVLQRISIRSNSLRWIKVDTDLDSLRGHPRFKALMGEE